MLLRVRNLPKGSLFLVLLVVIIPPYGLADSSNESNGDQIQSDGQVITYEISNDQSSNYGESGQGNGVSYNNNGGSSNGGSRTEVRRYIESSSEQSSNGGDSNQGNGNGGGSSNGNSDGSSNRQSDSNGSSGSQDQSSGNSQSNGSGNGNSNSNNGEDQVQIAYQANSNSNGNQGNLNQGAGAVQTNRNNQGNQLNKNQGSGSVQSNSNYRGNQYNSNKNGGLQSNSNQNGNQVNLNDGDGESWSHSSNYGESGQGNGVSYNNNGGSSNGGSRTEVRRYVESSSEQSSNGADSNQGNGNGGGSSNGNSDGSSNRQSDNNGSSGSQDQSSGNSKSNGSGNENSNSNNGEDQVQIAYQANSNSNGNQGNLNQGAGAVQTNRNNQGNQLNKNQGSGSVQSNSNYRGNQYNSNKNGGLQSNSNQNGNQVNLNDGDGESWSWQSGSNSNGKNGQNGSNNSENNGNNGSGNKSPSNNNNSGGSSNNSNNSGKNGNNSPGNNSNNESGNNSPSGNNNSGSPNNSNNSGQNGKNSPGNNSNNESGNSSDYFSSSDETSNEESNEEQNSVEGGGSNESKDDSPNNQLSNEERQRCKSILIDILKGSNRDVSQLSNTESRNILILIIQQLLGQRPNSNTLKNPKNIKVILTLIIQRITRNKSYTITNSTIILSDSIIKELINLLIQKRVIKPGKPGNSPGGSSSSTPSGSGSQTQKPGNSGESPSGKNREILVKLIELFQVSNENQIKLPTHKIRQIVIFVIRRFCKNHGQSTKINEDELKKPDRARNILWRIIQLIRRHLKNGTIELSDDDKKQLKLILIRERIIISSEPGSGSGSPTTPEPKDENQRIKLLIIKISKTSNGNGLSSLPNIEQYRICAYLVKIINVNVYVNVEKLSIPRILRETLNLLLKVVQTSNSGSGSIDIPKEKKQELEEKLLREKIIIRGQPPKKLETFVRPPKESSLIKIKLKLVKILNDNKNNLDNANLSDDESRNILLIILICLFDGNAPINPNADALLVTSNNRILARICLKIILKDNHYNQDADKLVLPQQVIKILWVLLRTCGYLQGSPSGNYIQPREIESILEIILKINLSSRETAFIKVHRKNGSPSGDQDHKIVLRIFEIMRHYRPDQYVKDHYSDREANDIILLLIRIIERNTKKSLHFNKNQLNQVDEKTKREMVLVILTLIYRQYKDNPGATELELTEENLRLIYFTLVHYKCGVKYDESVYGKWDKGGKEDGSDGGFKSYIKSILGQFLPTIGHLLHSSLVAGIVG